MTYIAQSGRLRGRWVMGCDRAACRTHYVPRGTPIVNEVYRRAHRRGWRFSQVGVTHLSYDYCSEACAQAAWEVFHRGAVVAGQIGA